jgi:hypothetical protein
MHTSGGFLCKLICDGNCHKKQLNNATIQANVLDKKPFVDSDLSLGSDLSLESHLLGNTEEIVYDKKYVSSQLSILKNYEEKTNTKMTDSKTDGTNLASNSNRIRLKMIVDNKTTAWKYGIKAIGNYDWYNTSNESIYNRYNDTLNCAALIINEHRKSYSLLGSIKWDLQYYNPKVNVLTTKLKRPGIIQSQKLYYAAQANVEEMSELYNYVRVLAKFLHGKLPKKTAPETS